MFFIFKNLFYRFIPSAHISSYVRLLYLRQFLKHGDFQDVLDAGCGPGLFSFYVAEKLPEARVSGYDFSQKNILVCNVEKGMRCSPNVSFKRVNLTDSLEKGQFDFIFSIDVLEHIPGNGKVLRNFYKWLKAGGTLYLAMPYEAGHRYLLPRRLFRKYIAWAKKEHVGEQYDLDEMLAILSRQIGFSIVNARYTFGFWGKLSWELDMLTEGNMFLKHLLQPLLFVMGYLDTLWKNRPGSYGIRVIARKTI
jgi:SAM-dependent methyltransferase